MRPSLSKVVFWPLLLLVALIVGCSKSDDAATTTTTPALKPMVAEKVSLRLAWVFDMAEVGILVAKEKGFFQKEGLDVTIEPGGFGLDPIKLVAAGSNDFGIGGAGNLLLARA